MTALVEAVVPVVPLAWRVGTWRFILIIGQDFEYRLQLTLKHSSRRGKIERLKEQLRCLFHGTTNQNSTPKETLQMRALRPKRLTLVTGKLMCTLRNRELGTGLLLPQFLSSCFNLQTNSSSRLLSSFKLNF